MSPGTLETERSQLGPETYEYRRADLAGMARQNHA